MKRALIAFLPLALWSAAVLAVGAFEFDGVSVPSGADKLVHFLMYGVGGVLAAWAAYVQGRRAGWLGLALVVLTGVVDELRQSTIPTRDGDVMDWVADAAGALILFLMARRILKITNDDE